jgi:hypothetical protein
MTIGQAVAIILGLDRVHGTGDILRVQKAHLDHGPKSWSTLGSERPENIDFFRKGGSP